jgi:hypothetical protein
MESSSPVPFKHHEHCLNLGAKMFDLSLENLVSERRPLEYEQSSRFRSAARKHALHNERSVSVLLKMIFGPMYDRHMKSSNVAGSGSSSVRFWGSYLPITNGLWLCIRSPWSPVVRLMFILVAQTIIRSVILLSFS